MEKNHLIAFSKKNRTKTIYKVASSDDEFFKNQLEEQHNGIEEYDPNDRQDQGKIFFLDLSEYEGITNEIIEELKEIKEEDNINTANYKALSASELDGVKYVATKKGQYILFQHFYKKNIIGSKVLSLKKMQILKGDFITLNEYAEVAYDIKDKKIYFSSIVKAKNILSGIEVIYKEAGTKETKTFMNQKHIQLLEEFDEMKVNVLNKKRIQAEIDKQSKIKIEKGDGYETFYIKDIAECLAEIKDYYPEMLDGDKILIKDNKDLENYLLALDERLYTAKRSQQQRVATATRKVEKSKA
ncbi:hypothetical protein A6J33_023385 [Pantoea sp. FDAARGOS_194]|jgi:hypothetical protein|uniref:hypothetical protein n=1 Tax=Pantoea TaxID=53335 RepID=UPI000BB58B28|nr:MULTISPECIES: hypothetical protein [Pantoea]PNK59395.1 hypothetical protein A6J33_023385 [Pantoea sp. FDAARGOS_194]